MGEDQLERDVLSRAGIDRRSFIRKMVLGAAFAVPVMVSCDMLASSIADGATCYGPNGTSGTSGSGTTGGSGGTRARQPLPGACGGTPDGGAGGGSAQSFSDRRMKTAVVPVAWD